MTVLRRIVALVIWTLTALLVPASVDGSAGIESRYRQEAILRNVYIAELENGQDGQEFLDNLKDKPDINNITRRFAFRPSIFNAVSFTVDGSLTSSPQKLERRISELPQVKRLWPVDVISVPKWEAQTPAKGFNFTDKARSVKRDNGTTFPPHTMAQVDKLRAQGYTGKDIRIGIIDTGVDYRHPALGGCFGPGCLVEYGADLVGDNFGGDAATLIPDDDPFEDCNGHGTLIAGVIAAQENPLGFTGAAPGVTLGVYRVFGCPGYTTSDVMIEAIIRAHEDGSDIITSSVGVLSGWAQHPVSEVMSRVTKAGVPCTAAVSNAEGGNYGIWSAAAPSSGEGVLAIASFQSIMQPSINPDTGDVTYLPGSQGGWVNDWSNWGPTFQGELKPQFGAPGGSILTTAPESQGSYAVVSGTSLSTPMAAAIIALLYNVRGKMSPAEVRNLLSSTANPSFSATTGSQDLGSAAQQGGGLIQAYDAAYETTLLSVSSLSFNDTDFLVPEKEFVVTNSCNSTSVYNFSNVPAISVDALNDMGFRNSRPEPRTSFATLEFDPPFLTLPPGSKGSVSVSIRPPRGLDASLLPIYSGYIAINGTGDRDISLSIPYVGIAGSMKGAELLGLPSHYFVTRTDDPRNPSLANGTVVQFHVPDEHRDWAVPPRNDSDLYLPPGVLPSLGMWMRIGTPELRLEVVLDTPSSIDQAPTTRENELGDETLGSIPGFPRYFEIPIGLMASWNGQLADGSWAPPGQYHIRLYGLRHYGDRDNKEDWDVLDFSSFGITYVESGQNA